MKRGSVLTHEACFLEGGRLLGKAPVPAPDTPPPAFATPETLLTSLGQSRRSTSPSLHIASISFRARVAQSVEHSALAFDS